MFWPRIEARAALNCRTQITNFWLIRTWYIRLFWLECQPYPAAWRVWPDILSLDLGTLALASLYALSRFGCLHPTLTRREADCASICPWLTVAALGTVFLGTEEGHAVFYEFLFRCTLAAPPGAWDPKTDFRSGLPIPHHVAGHESFPSVWSA